MNLADARIALRTRGTLDVLDVALRFYVKNARAYLLPSILCVVPGAVLASLAGWAGGPMWGWLVAIGMSLFAATPVTAATAKLVFDESPAGADIVYDTVKKNLALVPLRMFQLFAIAAGGLLFILPGIWLLVMFFVAPEVSVAEGSTTGATVSRAQRILSAAFGEIAVMGLVVLVGRIAWLFVADAAGRSILEDLLQINAPQSLLDSGGGPISYTAFFLILPLEAVARFLFYLNVRTKTEGWDIQARFLAIARRHEDALGDPQGSGL